VLDRQRQLLCFLTYSLSQFHLEQDAGTGIQPFLPPIAVSGSPFQQITYSCVAYTVATAKLAALAIVALAYALLVGLPGALLVRTIDGISIVTQAEPCRYVGMAVECESLDIEMAVFCTATAGTEYHGIPERRC
jgi:hypothetical protein